MQGDDSASASERGLDVREAARLLAQTQRRAQRELDFSSPWLSLLAAATALLALGAVWLSVRDQHPYKGPTLVGLVGLCAVVLISTVAAFYAHRRATAGVSGRSVRQQRAEGAGLPVALVAVFAVLAALAHDGASDGVVYGLYVLTATLLVLGAFWAARSAAREDWQGLCTSLAVMLVAATGAFAGPRGVWLSDGLGLCAVLLGCSAVQAWLRRSYRYTPDGRLA